MSTEKNVGDVSQATGSAPELKEENLTKEQLDYKKSMLKFKDRADELEARLKEIEMAEEQKRGNYAEVISKYKNELAEAKKENKTLKYNFANARLEESIKAEAAARGLRGTQLDAFIKLVDPSEKKLVEFDDTFNVRSEDIKGIVDNSFKRYSDLFKPKVKVFDGAPSAKESINGKPEKTKNVNDMSVAELMAYAKQNKDKII